MSQLLRFGLGLVPVLFWLCYLRAEALGLVVIGDFHNRGLVYPFLGLAAAPVYLAFWARWLGRARKPPVDWRLLTLLVPVAWAVNIAILSAPGVADLAVPRRANH